MALSRIKRRLTTASSGQPEFEMPEYMSRPPIAEVEYRLIKSKDKSSIQKMIDSAVKFGIFQLAGHGISPEELNVAFTEAEFCFGLLAERWSRDGDREEFAWSRSAMTAAECRKEVKNDDQYLLFRQKTDNLAKKLEAIAKDVAQIIRTSGGKQPRKKIKENETRMTLFKHSNSSLQPHTPRSCQTPGAMDGPRRDSATFALGLHIPTESGEFRLLSEDGPFSFRANPPQLSSPWENRCRGGHRSSLIHDQMPCASNGRRLSFAYRYTQEWSYGEFRSVFGEINIEPDIQEDKGAYSVELKCSPSILNEAVDKNDRISITDQIIFVVVVAIVYKLFTYLLS